MRFLETASLQCFFEIARPKRAFAVFRPSALGRDRTVNIRSRLRFAFLNTRPYEAASGSRLFLVSRYPLFLFELVLDSVVVVTARVGLRCELRPALRTAALQNEASCLGCHTRAEAMGAGPLQFAWLECAFHVPSTCVSAAAIGARPKKSRQGYAPFNFVSIE